ncbi:MAG: hypothetical protein ACI9WU_001392 [Myxococcota bacterium]|jgi:hypothetical protein
MNDSKKASEGVWQTYVLLPGSDVPESGSRTEIVVTPSQCLRVQVRETEDGRLEFRKVEA